MSEKSTWFQILEFLIYDFACCSSYYVHATKNVEFVAIVKFFLINEYVQKCSFDKSVSDIAILMSE